MPTVLFVEDEIMFFPFWKEFLKDEEITRLEATTVQMAEELFENNDVDAIVMDACVPGREPNTIDLTKKIRNRFSGPILGTSSNPNFQDLQKLAGCSHLCTKLAVPKTLMQVLSC